MNYDMELKTGLVKFRRITNNVMMMMMMCDRVEGENRKILSTSE